MQGKTWSGWGGTEQEEIEFSRKVNESLQGNGERMEGHQKEEQFDIRL